MEQQNHLEVQAQIAKVLASENIDVEFRNIETAAFDPVNRRLIVPQYKDGLSKSMYDLFIGHEVGHALYTPQIAPTEIRKDLPNFAQFVNVVEDVRIERKIRSRFPGLTKSFVNGYNDLLERNFFGDFSNRPLSDRSLADRLNIFFKVGAFNSGLEFFDDELSIKEKIESADTWEEVIAAAELLYEYAQSEKMNENKPQQEQQQSENNEDDNETFGNDEQSAEDGEGTSADEEESGDGEEGNGEEESEESSDDKDGVEDEGTSINGFSNGYENSEPEIETQVEFDKNRVDSIEEETQYGEHENVYIDTFNLDDIIINYKDLYNHLDVSFSKRENNFRSLHESSKVFHMLKKSWNKFRAENNKVVMSSAREFEMRKSADDFKRTKVSKTGVIDMNALHKYRFTEDIFLKQAVVKDGKNHSLTMFVDWSGSMCDIMSDTISQLQVLALFCKKVNIPFEVYAFTNNFSYLYMYPEMRETYYLPQDGKDVNRRNTLYKKYDGSFAISNEFALFNLLSSDMSKSDFDHANLWLEYMKVDMRRWGDRDYTVEPFENFAKWFSLGGTPLNETFAIIPQLMERLNKKNKSQINNIVFLTDGCGSSTHYCYRDKYNDVINISINDTIIDKKTKRAVKFTKNGYGAFGYGSGIINLLADRVKEQVDCNLINFHIIQSRPQTISSTYNDFGIGYNHTWEQYRDKSKSLRKDGFIVEDKTYYDKMFIVNKTSMKINDDDHLGELVAGEASKAQIKNALIKDTKGNKSSRIIMTNFAGIVAA